MSFARRCLRSITSSITRRAHRTTRVQSRRSWLLAPIRCLATASGAFDGQVDKTFSFLTKGLEPLEAANTDFSVESGDAKGTMYINLGEKVGSYSFNADPKKKKLTMFSPVSTAVYSYSFDKGNDAWVSDDDGHLLVELLTRELMSSCSGFPDF